MPEQTPATEAPLGIAAQRYASLKTDRESVLNRARELSGLTIPYLFRREGEGQDDSLEVPWNSIGAYCVSNLSAKVIFSIFPPGQAPMMLTPDRSIKRQWAAMEDQEQAGLLQTETEAGLSEVEDEFVDAFEEDGDRAPLTLGVQRMLVGGTECFHFTRGGKVRGIGLQNFVCKRDRSGNLLEFIIEDALSWSTLPDDIKGKCKALHEMAMAESTSKDQMGAWADPKTIMVYTHGYLEGGLWTVYQECWGFEVAGTRYTREADLLPYLFCPWVLVQGEDYGRSYVELYEGDLQTIEGNTQTIAEGAAALARFITMVRPGGLTNRKTVAEADNGAVISGREEDVKALTYEGKGTDFAVVEAVTERAEQRLARAFLLYSSVQRKGERVTAEEIKTVAQDLDNAQVGAYSQQVVTLQGPYVRIKLWLLQKAGRVTALPKGLTKVTILGGLAALGRNAELMTLREWAMFLKEMFGDAWMQVLGPKAMREVAKRAATALRLRTDGIIPTKVEAEALDQNAQMQGMMANPAAQEMIKQLGSNLTANQVADTNNQTKLDVAAMGAQPGPPAEAQPA